MRVISTKEFRTHQGKFLDLVNEGEDVILKSRNRGSFKIVPVTEDDTLMSKEEFFAKLDKSIQEIKEGKCHTMLPGESLEDFLDRIENENNEL